MVEYSVGVYVYEEFKTFEALCILNCFQLLCTLYRKTAFCDSYYTFFFRSNFSVPCPRKTPDHFFIFLVLNSKFFFLHKGAIKKCFTKQ